MTTWPTNWQSGRPIDRMTNQLPKWPNEWQTNWSNDWPIDQVTEWMTDQLIKWLTNWPNDRPFGQVTNKLTKWPIEWRKDRRIDRNNDRPNDWPKITDWMNEETYKSIRMRQWTKMARWRLCPRLSVVYPSRVNLKHHWTNACVNERMNQWH